MRITKDRETIKQPHGNSMVIQWLRLLASTAGLQVKSLVRELRPHMFCGRFKLKQQQQQQQQHSLTRKQTNPECETFFKLAYLVAQETQSCEK